MLRIAEIDQRVQPLDRLENDIAAAPAIAAVRAAIFDIFLAAKADRARAACAGFQIDLGLVEKMHGLYLGVPARKDQHSRNDGRAQLLPDGSGIGWTTAPEDACGVDDAPGTGWTTAPVGSVGWMVGCVTPGKGCTTAPDDGVGCTVGCVVAPGSGWTISPEDGVGCTVGCVVAPGSGCTIGPSVGKVIAGVVAVPVPLGVVNTGAGGGGGP